MKRLAAALLALAACASLARADEAAIRKSLEPKMGGVRIDSVNAIEARVGLPQSQVEHTAMSGGPHPMTYGVGHAAQVLAFTPDDSLRAEYPSGFTVDDWANDLPRLLKVTRR